MTDYLSVTELAGDEVTQEQVQRICNRYYWAGNYCQDKDVLEVACGTGQGLGYLSGVAKSIVGGDYSAKILEIAKAHYGSRVEFMQFDAQVMPFPDCSKDVIIIFEAIYYLPDVERFVAECRRVLRAEGKVLVATANKDLFDFNPSPYTYNYYGVVELKALFERYGFDTEFWGDTPVGSVSLRQKVFRPIKKIATSLGLIPKTTSGKLWLKKLVFGKMNIMPAEITVETAPKIEPVRLDSTKQDKEHKVIFCAATLKTGLKEK